MQNDKDLLKGHRASFTKVFLLEASLWPTGPGSRKLLWSSPALLCVGLSMLRRGLESLGYRRSCYDPCIFCLMDESGPHGHILIEVDDLATQVNAVRAENMAKLQKTFKFGKWKSIYNSEGDYASRTVIHDQFYVFHVHQAQFVQIRNHPMVKRDNCVQCGAQSIGSSERPVLICQH